MQCIPARAGSIPKLGLVLLGFLLSWPLAGWAGEEAVLSADDITDPLVLVELPDRQITGSRLPRLSVEPILPVVRWDSGEFEKMGVATVSEMVRRLPITLGSTPTTANPVNLNGAQQGVNFRGLGQNNTLVLVNGRRIPIFPQADANILGYDLGGWPAGAIEAVEILPEGASAVYGSDAVAGVVNIILKKNYHGGGIRIGWEEFADTSFNRQTASLWYGQTGERWNFLLALDYARQDDVRFGDRPRSRSEDYKDRGGVDGRQNFGFPGQMQLPANTPGADPSLLGGYITVGSVTPEGIIHGPPTSHPQVGDFVRLPLPTTQGKPTPGTTTNNFDRAPWTSMIPEEEGYGFSAIGEHALTQAVTFFAELGWRHRVIASAIHPTPAGTILESGAGDGPNGVLVFPAHSPYQPFGVDITDLKFQLVELGPRIREYSMETPRLVAGLRGQFLDDWQWQGGFLQSRHRVTENALNFITDRGLQDGLAGRAGGYINPFGFSDPGVIDGLRTSMRIDQEQTLRMADFWTGGSLWELPAGQINLTTGGEWREEIYQREPDALAQTGGYAAWSRILPVTLARRIWAGYLETSVPVLRGLSAYAALRYENYSDFGSSLKPKLSLAWTASSRLHFRISRSESFKAPEILDLQSAQTEYYSSITDPLRPDLGAYAVRFRIGGNPDLEAEETVSWRASTEFFFDSAQQHGVEVAYWIYEKENLIGSVDVSKLLEEEQANGSSDRIVRLPNESDGKAGQVTFVNNTIGNFDEALAEGLDLRLFSQLDGKEWGDFHIEVTATYLSRDYYTPKGQPRIELAGKSGYPRWRGLASLTWSRSGWSTTLSAEYIAPQQAGGLRYDGGSTDYDPFLQCNLTIQKRFLDRWQAGLTVGNLFDQDPPRDWNGGRGYATALYDNRGRSYALRLQYEY